MLHDWTTLKKLVWLNCRNGEKTLGPASIVSFIGRANTEILSLTAAIAPIQDLHGYDHPWPAGGGKNKATAQFSDYNQYGITLTRVSSGVYTINGTNTRGSVIPLVANFDTPLPAGTYTFSANNDKVARNANVYIGFKTSGGADPSADVRSYVNAKKTYTATQPITQLFISIFNGASFDNITFKLQLEAGSEATTFAPPENICPITGRTGASAYVSPTQDVADATTYPVTWQTEAGTVYGGTVDVVSGVLTVDRANIPSYNGETITEPWLSSMDEYTPGATPTTGAQVVYKLATPLTYQLTPQTVAALVGQNYVWADTGDVTVTVKL